MRLFYLTSKRASIKSSWRRAEISCDNGRIYWINDFKSQRSFTDKQHITVTSVSANMTPFYQQVDLTVNGGAQKFHCKEV